VWRNAVAAHLLANRTKVIMDLAHHLFGVLSRKQIVEKLTVPRSASLDDE